MPAWLEGRADERARQALSDCDGSTAADGCTAVDAIDIDAAGIWISKIGRRVGRHQIVAHDVRVAPRWRELDGFDVDVGELTLAPVAAPPTPARTEPATAERPATPSARPVPDTHGAKIHVRVREPIALPATHDVAMTLTDAELLLDGQGGLRSAARATVTHPRLREAVQTTLVARVRGDLDHWQAEGDTRLADRSLHWAASAADPASPRDGGVQWSATTDEGSVVATTDRDATTLQVSLVSFPLDTTKALADLGVPAWVGLDAATVSGQLETTRALDHVLLSQVTVRGAVVDHRKLSREPLSLDGVQIDGDVARAADGGFAQLTLSRADASAQLSVSASDRRFAFDLQLPPTDCQAVVDALPHAMRDALDGLRLRGELSGHASLTVDRVALQAARQKYQGRPGDVPPRAGELDLDVPFEQSCIVESDPAGVDLEGLLGPYRHRFAGGDGLGRRTRVMAPGAEGYVPLSRIELLGEAFQTLEDSRFLEHDGFDREQIANALWHNLIRGGVQRGASTISQQTTRNLWLGVDRSAARKLQEALLTTRLEAAVPKRRILELYLNLIELGPGLYGVEAAAQHYFGKSAGDLSVRETVHIAALAPAPSRFAERFADGEVDDEWEAWIDRQIRRMYLARHITRAQRDRAMRERTVLVRRERAGSDARE